MAQHVGCTPGWSACQLAGRSYGRDADWAVEPLAALVYKQGPVEPGCGEPQTGCARAAHNEPVWQRPAPPPALHAAWRCCFAKHVGFARLQIDQPRPSRWASVLGSVQPQLAHAQAAAVINSSTMAASRASSSHGSARCFRNRPGAPHRPRPGSLGGFRRLGRASCTGLCATRAWRPARVNPPADRISAMPRPLRPPLCICATKAADVRTGELRKQQRVHPAANCAMSFSDPACTA